MTEKGKPAPRRTKRSAQAELPTRAALAGAHDRLLRLDEVKQIANIGKTMIYRLMREDRFPKACKPVGSSSSRWSEREVTIWLEDQLAERSA